MCKWIPILCLVALTVSAESPKEAPKLSATDLHGENVILDSLLSQGPAYVSFWALWCKSCIRELDELCSMYEKYHEKGFELIAINQDGPRSIHRVKPMVKGKRWKFKVLLDTGKELSRAFQVIALPTSFLIDQDGKIVKTLQGFRPGMKKLIEEKLKQLLIEEKEEVEDEEEEGSETEKKDQDS